MKALIALALLVTGVIHLLPLAGVTGAPRLATLYGVDIADPNLVLLMRHRAVLFGLLGVYLCGAAFRPAWRTSALVAGFVSVVSFLVLAWMTAGTNVQLDRVVIADLVALACLVVATIVHAKGRDSGLEIRDS